MKTYDVNGVEIDKGWAAEFRGFFFGEGYLGITTNGNHRRGKKRLLARAAITLRQDDGAMLEEIHKRLGGLIHYEGRRISKTNGKAHVTKPYVVWRVTGKEDVGRVCDLLECGVMPSKKLAEVKVMRQYLETIGLQKPGPKHGADAEEARRIEIRRFELAEELKKMHGRISTAYRSATP